MAPLGTSMTLPAAGALGACALLGAPSFLVPRAVPRAGAPAAGTGADAQTSGAGGRTHAGGAAAAAAGMLLLTAAGTQRAVSRTVRRAAPESRIVEVATQAEGKAVATFDPSTQVGALAPLGFWDPAGLAKDEATFRAFRTAEIKHARVAMMAAVGLVAQHSFRFPGFGFDTPSGVAAITDPHGGQGLGVLFLVAGFYELNLWTESEGKSPGDYGDPMSWNLAFPGLADEQGNVTEDIRNRELNNGRFAMMATMGIFAAEYQTGLDGVDQFSAAVARWKQMGGFENF